MAFTGTLQSAIAQTQDFKATIAQLVKLGARTDVLQQFLDKGPDSAAAASLACGSLAAANAASRQSWIATAHRTAMSRSA
jgi:hypothetical protein